MPTNSETRAAIMALPDYGEGKFLILTDYGTFYGKDGYSVHRGFAIDEAKCFDSDYEADDAADQITDHRYEIVNVATVSNGTFTCPHCRRGFQHQHIIDKKGNVYETILTSPNLKHSARSQGER